MIEYAPDPRGPPPKLEEEVVSSMRVDEPGTPAELSTIQAIENMLDDHELERSDTAVAPLEAGEEGETDEAMTKEDPVDIGHEEGADKRWLHTRCMQRVRTLTRQICPPHQQQ